jgi:hypothetical protein
MFRNTYVTVTNTGVSYPGEHGYPFHVYDDDKLAMREEWFNGAKQEDVIYIISKCFHVYVKKKSGGGCCGIGGFVGKFLGGLLSGVSTLVNKIWALYFKIPFVRVQFRIVAWLIAKVFNTSQDRMEFYLQEAYKVVTYIVLQQYYAVQGAEGAEAANATTTASGASTAANPETVGGLELFNNFATTGDYVNALVFAGKTTVNVMTLDDRYERKLALESTSNDHEAAQQKRNDALNELDEDAQDVYTFEQQNGVRYGDLHRYDPYEDIHNQFDPGGEFDVLYNMPGIKV